MFSASKNKGDGSGKVYTVEDSLRDLDDALAKINAERARIEAEHHARMKEIAEQAQETKAQTALVQSDSIEDQIRALANIHAECLAQQAKGHMDQAKYHENQMGGDGDKSDSLQKEINQLSRGKGRVTNADRIQALKQEKERIDARVVPLRQYAAEEKNKALSYSVPRLELVNAIKTDNIDDMVKYGSSITCLGKGGDQFTKLAAQRTATIADSNTSNAQTGLEDKGNLEEEKCPTLMVDDAEDYDGQNGVGIGLGYPERECVSNTKYETTTVCGVKAYHNAGIHDEYGNFLSNYKPSMVVIYKFVEGNNRKELGRCTP